MVRYLPALLCGCVVVGVGAARPAQAANYYVDGSCGVSGNGTVDGCASSAGGGGAFRDPQSCFATARAGDTCFIKNGTYITTNQGASDPSVDGGFHIANSGTASAPVVFRNYPGHSPLLANCSPGSTQYLSCARPTISGDHVRYFRIQGLRIHGGIWIVGGDATLGQGQPGVVIEGNEITQGWGEVDDGNWGAIVVGELQGAVIRNNYIHDVAVLAGGGQQSSGTCVKLYHNADTVVEYNTCRNVNITESQAGGIDDKAQAVRNIHRFNWIENVNACVRVNNQLNSTGVQVYGNVCIGREYALKPLTLINGVDFYNNTVHGFYSGVYEGGANTAVRVYNNIFANMTNNNLESYGSGTSFRFDYNAYTSGRPFRALGRWYSTASELAAGTGWDVHSRQVDCQFVSPGADFHLRAGSSCIGAGRTGGTTSGSPVDLGAYGVTTCVGHTCGSGGPPNPTPASPTNLQIIR